MHVATVFHLENEQVKGHVLSVFPTAATVNLLAGLDARRANPTHAEDPGRLRVGLQGGAGAGVGQADVHEETQGVDDIRGLLHTHTESVY